MTTDNIADQRFNIEDQGFEGNIAKRLLALHIGAYAATNEIDKAGNYLISCLVEQHDTEDSDEPHVRNSANWMVVSAGCELAWAIMKHYTIPELHGLVVDPEQDDAYYGPICAALNSLLQDHYERKFVDPEDD